jgi:hypothetical protein
VASLKEYFERQFNLFENNINQRFNSIKEATDKSETSNNHRLDSMNEIRRQLDDQAKTFVTKIEYEGGFKNLVEKVENLKERIDKMDNISKGGLVVWPYVISIISLLVIVVMVIIDIIKT